VPSVGRTEADLASAAGRGRLRECAGLLSIHSRCSFRFPAGRSGSFPGCGVPNRCRRIWPLGFVLAAFLLLWSEHNTASAAPPGSKPLGARRRENTSTDRSKLQGAIALLPLGPVEETDQAAANCWRKAPNEPGVAPLQTTTLTTSTMESARPGGNKAAAHHLLHRGDADPESMKRRSPNPPRLRGRPGKKSIQNHHRATKLPRHHGRTRGSAAASWKGHHRLLGPLLGGCRRRLASTPTSRAEAKKISASRHRSRPEIQGPSNTRRRALKPKLGILSYSFLRHLRPPWPPEGLGIGPVFRELGVVTVEGSGGERGKCQISVRRSDGSLCRSSRTCSLSLAVGSLG
jgi:hypothetical protein